MIKCENGAVSADGNIVELTADVGCIIYTIMEGAKNNGIPCGLVEKLINESVKKGIAEGKQTSNLNKTKNSDEDTESIGALIEKLADKMARRFMEE